MSTPTKQDRLIDQLAALSTKMNPPIRAFLDKLSGHRVIPGTNWRWPGIYLGFGASGSVWSGPDHHVLVIGPPRSGKTTSIVIPTVALHRGPIVVTSTKADVFYSTAQRRAQLGRCWLWDPTGSIARPTWIEQLRWSPVQGCQHWDTTVARAWALATAARPGQHLTDAGHWVERAQALLAPLLHAAALADADLACVLSWLHRRELTLPLDILERNRAHLAHDLLYGISVTEHREQSGIFSTADSILAAYRTNTALAATRNPNFDPDSFVNGADTLYICSPGSAQAQHAPLVVALLQHLRDAISRRRQPLPPVIWALDELANIAPLPDLPAVIADSAAQGLLVLACLQDLSQARARWGTAADGFLTLFPTDVILPGVADLATLNVISAIAGEIDVRRISTTKSSTWGRGPTSSRSTTNHYERRPRLPVHTVSQGDVGRGILLTGTSPSLLRLTPWYGQPALRQLLASHSS